MKKEVMFTIVAVFSALVAIILPRVFAWDGSLTTSLLGILFGVGIAFLICGLRLALKARKSVRLPFIAVIWLMIEPWLSTLPLPNWSSWIALLTIIAAILILALDVWKQINHGAGRMDDDVRRGGFDVW